MFNGVAFTQDEKKRSKITKIKNRDRKKKELNIISLIGFKHIHGMVIVRPFLSCELRPNMEGMQGKPTFLNILLTN